MDDVEYKKEFDRKFDRDIARWEMDSEIYCPYCKELQEDSDGFYPVTYYGEPEETEMECQSCGKNFVVAEHVERTYTVRTALGEELSGSDLGEELIQKKITERAERFKR